MDAQRFDALARGLARRASRRSVLRGAAGGAVAGVLVGAGVRPAGAQCPAGQTACGGACVDLMTDMANCGACGEVCESGLVGVACIGGACLRVTCPPALTECGTGGEPRPYEEHCFDLASDPNNCGACGNACASGACTGGACAPSDGSGELGDLGDACSEVLPCQRQLVCAGGVCSRPTLPNTGAGSTAGTGGNGGSGWLAPAALAGAAALVVSRLRGTTGRNGAAD